jgi:hypothetical protein
MVYVDIYNDDDDNDIISPASRAGADPSVHYPELGQSSPTTDDPVECKETQDSKQASAQEPTTSMKREFHDDATTSDGWKLSQSSTPTKYLHMFTLLQTSAKQVRHIGDVDTCSGTTSAWKPDRLPAYMYDQNYRQYFPRLDREKMFRSVDLGFAFLQCRPSIQVSLRWRAFSIHLWRLRFWASSIEQYRLWWVLN